MSFLISISIVVLQISLLASAAWLDVVSRLIPNRICLVLAMIGMFGRLLDGPGALLISVTMAVVLFVILSFLHNFKMLGGGDVKLLTALSLGLSPIGVAAMLIVTILAGGVLSLMHLMMRRLPVPRLARVGSSMFRRVYAVERWRIIRHAPLPYGAAIACGGIWTVLKTIGV
jgi:prepilin peptidase CpaA